MSGYREDKFDLDTPEPKEPLSQSEARGVNRMVITFGVLLLLALEILSWFTERGGIISVISALTSLQAMPPVIDIDKAGLRFPIMLLLILVLVGASRLLGLKLGASTRRKAWIPLLFVIGGGFILDAAFGESIITRYMTAHGYSRCEMGDWAQGNRKSRVWFADYVRQDVECRRRKSTIPEYSPFG